jgi:hypothetical protein
MVLRVEVCALMAAHRELRDVIALLLNRRVRRHAKNGIARKARLAVSHGMGKIDEFHVSP